MLERIPIRIRLSLGHALWIAALFAAIGFGVNRVVEDSVLQTLDATLMTSARTMLDAQLSRSDRLSALQNQLYEETDVDEMLEGQRIPRQYAQLVDTSGKVRARTNLRVNLTVTPLAYERASRGMETFETFRNWGSPLRQLTIPVIRNNRWTGELIQVAALMTASLNTINSVKMMLWISLSLGLATSVLFGSLLLKWSFKPVARITQDVGKLGFTENFDQRLKIPRADDELRQLVKTFNEMLGRIEDAFGRLRRFAGDVSHELRTPISVLRGEAELALRRERSPEEYRASLLTIVDEASQMSNIVEDLLLLARAQGQSIPIHPEDVSIRDFVHELEHTVQKNYEDRQVRLKVDTHGLENHRIKIAKGYLVLALKNILLNACKHSAPGQTVFLDLRFTSRDFRFIIRDQGEGIPKEDIPYIFDLFYRADTARNRSSGGVGIGLSLAKALISLHSGQIEASSEAGQGATFTVILPNEKPSDRRISQPLGQKLIHKTMNLRPARYIFKKASTER